MPRRTLNQLRVSLNSASKRYRSAVEKKNPKRRKNAYNAMYGAERKLSSAIIKNTAKSVTLSKAKKMFLHAEKQLGNVHLLLSSLDVDAYNAEVNKRADKLNFWYAVVSELNGERKRTDRLLKLGRKNKKFN